MTTLSPAPKRTGGAQPAALPPSEREAILAVLDSERFVDKSATQVWAVLLDEGVYLGSVSTFYRVLRTAGQVIPEVCGRRWAARSGLQVGVWSPVDVVAPWSVEAVL